MLAEALRAAIEPDNVRSLIKKFGVSPESTDVEDWPWSIRICALGRFAIVIDDVPLRSHGKAQRRPLDLLKFLVAMGERSVASDSAVAALWPDFDGDAGHAFESTLHRLRKLLRRDDAILHVDGRLALNPKLVWVDAWALEHQLGKAEEAFADAGEARGSLAHDMAERALRLYRGHFLDGESDASWAVAMRDKLRSKLRSTRSRTPLGRSRRDLSARARARQSCGRALSPPDRHLPETRSACRRA
jgi:LuxR family transcriptional regulator, maltose regulon positive regulatory protein